MKEKTLLRTTLVAGSFLLFGCDVPDKPNLELCHSDYDRDQYICAMTDTPNVIYYVPASEMDHSPAMRSSEWEKVKNYTQQLREYIKLNCRAN